MSILRNRQPAHKPHRPTRVRQRPGPQSHNPATLNPVLFNEAFRALHDGYCTLPTSGKRVVAAWKRFQVTRPAEDELRAMFSKVGVTGLAVLHGAPSNGHALRDFDFADAYLRWAAANPQESATLPTTRTQRGYHVHGRLESEQFIIFGDGELRGDSGHYTLIPPSLHPDGGTYEWIIPLPPADCLPFLPQSLFQEWSALGRLSESQSRREFPTRSPRQPKTNQTMSCVACIACVPKSAWLAILASLPSRFGQRNRKIFELVRRLRAIAGLDTSPAVLRAILEEWHRLALENIRTKDLSESWVDFQNAWVAAKTPHGATLQAAYQASLSAPMPPIDGVPELGVLAGLCMRLATASGNREFFLGVHTVKDLFSVPQSTAWRWLQSLQFYGVIQLLRKGQLKDRQASVWRFVGTETRQ